jgi:hypothetical protein
MGGTVEKKSYPLVDWYGQDPMLLIEHPTGVFHSGQTGGMCCNHPQVEGLAIPLNNFGNREWAALPSTCPDGCCDKLSMDSFAKLSKVWPTQEHETYYIAPDPVRWRDGEESWLPVIIEPGKRQLREFESNPLALWLIGKKGFILTQDNCD